MTRPLSILTIAAECTTQFYLPSGQVSLLFFIKLHLHILGQTLSVHDQSSTPQPTHRLFKINKHLESTFLMRPPKELLHGELFGVNLAMLTLIMLKC